MGRKLALIIGNTEYTDPRFSTLSTPKEDVTCLAAILKDPGIGAFDELEPLINQEEKIVSRTVEKFFANKSREDLLLFYFSGHGMLDEEGHLYFALKDTEFEVPRASSLSAEFVREAMDRTRSQRVVLILDCCHSGAFANGQKGVLGGSVGTKNVFEPANGFGRWVLTATDATQYAWEGNQLISPGDTAPRTSVFTRYLVQGLRDGSADLDQDGLISVRDINNYIYEEVMKQQLKQTPSLWTYKEQGNVFIANNPRQVLPGDLLLMIQSPYSNMRLKAVELLGQHADSANESVSQQAKDALTKLIGDDSRKVSKAAARLMGTQTPSDAFARDRFAKLAQPLPPDATWQDRFQKTARRTRLGAKQSVQSIYSRFLDVCDSVSTAFREHKKVVFRVEISLVALVVAAATWHFAPAYMGGRGTSTAAQMATPDKPAEQPPTAATPSLAEPPVATPPAVDSKPKPASPLQVSELVMKTYLIEGPKPTYPPAAKNQNIEGQVVLDALIDKSGKVKSVKPLIGNHLLAKAAVSAAEQYQYRPYPDNENPIPVETRITYNFHLIHPQVPNAQSGITLSTNITPYLGDTGLPPGTKIFSQRDKGVSVPQKIFGEAPPYKKTALKAGLEGFVILQILVRPDGTVGPVKLLHPLDPALNQSAINTVQKWQFKPGLKDGKPVAVWADITINFVLPVSPA
jgi:TonB family protein